MADNTTINTGTGGDVIATDDLTTLNGGAVSGVKVQRVKIGWGVDATQTDVTAANPLPVSNGQTQPLTDTQLRATAVPVSLATAPTTPVTGTFWQTTQPVSLASNTPTIAAGTALIGKVGIDQTTNGTTNAVNVVSRAAGGATTHTLISAATTNATSVKASAGTVYSIQASNTGTGVAFLKLFNLATAPTVGTSVAVKTLIIPAGGGIVLSGNDIGIAFGTGIAYSITGLATTADTTAVALAQVVVNIDYI